MLDYILFLYDTQSLGYAAYGKRDEQDGKKARWVARVSLPLHSIKILSITARSLYSANDNATPKSLTVSFHFTRKRSITLDITSTLQYSPIPLNINQSLLCLSASSRNFTSLRPFVTGRQFTNNSLNLFASSLSAVLTFSSSRIPLIAHGR